MIEFKILKKSDKSKARVGILKTPNGEVETPSLVGVATQATVKALTIEQVKQTKTQILISNTFHLHLKPGESIIESSHGLHTFMNWPKPLMTDSGGFQVFSLGFGRDYGIGKILKYFPGSEPKVIDKGQHPQTVKITHDGVFFRSPFDGTQLFIGPKESIQIQEKLKADIIFAFDECTAPLVNYDYAKVSVERTHRWAEICKEVHSTPQALFGIVQGSRFEDLRKKSAQFINSLDFPGFGIGGDLGQSKETMMEILNWVLPELNENKPRHLLGIGYPEDIDNITKAGIDLFDCTSPSHYGRRGIAFTSEGRLNLTKRNFLTDLEPLDRKCSCFVCQDYKRNYLAHLFKAKEMTGMSLLTYHNLYYFNQYVANIREKIKSGKF